MSRADSHPAVQQTPTPEVDTREALIVDALRRGVPYREITALHRVSNQTISRIAKQLDDYEQGTVAKLMSLKTLEMLDAWSDAAKRAAEMGKHAPMKDWLTHSKQLDPVQSDASSGAKVTIIIGSDASPLTPDLPQVIDVTPVTSDEG